MHISDENDEYKDDVERWPRPNLLRFTYICMVFQLHSQAHYKYTHTISCLGKTQSKNRLVFKMKTVLLSAINKNTYNFHRFFVVFFSYKNHIHGTRSMGGAPMRTF